jgi:hypothetical protein
MKWAHDFAKGDARAATSGPLGCAVERSRPCSDEGDRRGCCRVDDAFENWRESGEGGKVMKGCWMRSRETRRVEGRRQLTEIAVYLGWCIQDPNQVGKNSSSVAGLERVGW